MERRCDVCGGPLRQRSKLGVCARNPECCRERGRREYAANPQRKLDREKRYQAAGRPERERKAAERAQARAAELESMRARILELRSLGWSKDAIRAELRCGTPMIAEVLKGIPAQLCRICGGPMKASMSARSSGRFKSDTGICERNPECRRQRIQFSVRFKVVRATGQPTDLTTRYLVSIWTGRCVRLGCGKEFGPPGGPRNDAATLDRIIPADGYMQGNVRWLCGRCNRWKQDMTSADMRAMLLDQLQAERSR